MPALNIKYTQDELALLRERARAAGRPVTALVHDASVQAAALTAHDDLVMNAAAHVVKISEGLLRRLAER